MKCIFTQDISVGFNANDAATSVETLCPDSVRFPRVLIDPSHFSPAVRIQFIGCDQMKSFAVNTGRMQKAQKNTSATPEHRKRVAACALDRVMTLFYAGLPCPYG
jgi:hypothetical protein